MGQPESKLEKPNANVITNVEVVDHTARIDSLWFLLLCITVMTGANLTLKLYLLHKRSLRKKYASRADNLDKI